MSPVDAIKAMMKVSGVSASDLSRRIGKARTYISSTIAHGSVPRVDTMANIAHECGYRLYLINETDNCQAIELYSESETDSFAKLLDRLPDVIEAKDLAQEVNDWLARSGKLYRFDVEDATSFAMGVAIKEGKSLTITKNGFPSSMFRAGRGTTDSKPE